MLTHHNLFWICLMASVGKNLFDNATVDAKDHAPKSMVMKQQYLRTSGQEVTPTTAMPNSDHDEANEEDIRSLQYNSDYDNSIYNSGNDNSVYNLDDDNSVYIIDGEKVDIFTDDTLNEFIKEYCDGFKYKLDKNGVCRLSPAYIVLVTFINIAIIVGIVICSCACCKCCIWYPYLCCASQTEKRKRNQRSDVVPTMVVHVKEAIKVEKSSDVATVESQFGSGTSSAVKPNEPEINMSVPTGTTTYDC